MRIISGTYRSRVLHSPKDASTTRPIPDRVKESVFALLRGHFEGANVLDCFAGTGSIGLEAISRGAERCVFVERDKKIGDLLQQNIETLGCEEQAVLVRSDVFGPAVLMRAPKPLNLAFFDPPYPLVLEPEGWERVKRQFSRVIDLLEPTGFAVLRTPWPFIHHEVIHDDGRVEWRSPRVTKDDAEESPSRKGKAKQKGRDKDEDWEKAWEGPEVDVARIAKETEEDLDLDFAVGSEPNAKEYRVVKHMVDLAIENAKGPETHVYGSQGVHLYMKK